MVSPDDALERSPMIVTRPAGQVKQPTAAPLCNPWPGSFDSIKDLLLIGDTLAPHIAWPLKKISA